MSLVQIDSPPAAENAVIHLHAADNVAIARVMLPAGQIVRVDGVEVTSTQMIPAGHKIALREIAAGERVSRYGANIGHATRAIHAGDRVHTDNLAFEDRPELFDIPTHDLAIADVAKDVPTFLGYPRDDGRAGTRNYIAVAAASNCAAYTVELIASAFKPGDLPGIDGVVAFPHGEGCGHTIGPDTLQLQRVISGVLNHPNVAAGVLVGLGCEVNRIDEYFPDNTYRSERLVGLTLQSSGGTAATVEAAVREVQRLAEKFGGSGRVPVPASKIILGLNCGGSDSFSGITANPALGYASDMLAKIGAASILAETTEIFGAEQLLISRARNKEIAEKLIRYVHGYKTYLNQFGGSVNDNPSPGNKDGGLTNILEKSLGAVAKGGTSTMNEVYDYAEQITKPGFGFMNTPGYDPVSLTGLAAGGSNLIAFTTGRGSAIGFPTVPVLKISSNSAIFGRMRDNMDINAGRIADGEATIEQVGREIFDRLLEIASGQQTASERLGHHEFSPWRIGPVL